LLSLGLIALTLAAYAPVRHYPFVSLDDPQYVSDNPNVAQGLTWAALRWALTAGNKFYWHPVTWVSHMLDVQFYGMDAGSHHVTSVAIHVASSIVLFGVLYRMTAALGRSAFVGALFALHPLHVESVAWIAERKDVLSTLFWMLTVWAYLDYAAHPRLRRMVGVMLLFACGLMAKPMVVTLPFVLLLLDYWPLRRAQAGARATWVSLVREKLPLFALAIASSIVTVLVQRDAGAVVSLDQLPLEYRIGNAAVSYLVYVRDMLWPIRLAVFYPFIAPPSSLVVASLLTIAVAAVLAWRAASRFPYLLVGFLWYTVTLLPVIGIIQAGGQARADRFTYVPLIGLFIVIAWGVVDIGRALRLSEFVLRTAGGAVVALCTAVTVVQVKYWRNNVSLWSRAVEVTARNYRAENHLGAALADEGKLDAAVDHYSAALAIWPDFAEAHNNLGTARVDQGKPDVAIREFSSAVRIKPNDPTFHYNLAVALNEVGRKTEAIGEIDVALRLRPRDPNLIRARSVMTDSIK
jgi:tetratricopeptide (TPR) repeat protein